MAVFDVTEGLFADYPSVVISKTSEKRFQFEGDLPWGHCFHAIDGFTDFLTEIKHFGLLWLDE